MDKSQQTSGIKSLALHMDKWVLMQFARNVKVTKEAYEQECEYFLFPSGRPCRGVFK